MPTVEFKIERAGYAEQFVQNLQGTIPDMLDRTLEEIRVDVAAEAPEHSVGNPKIGDVSLSESFYTVPAEQVQESVWEGGIASLVPAKARAHEYGSGLHGTRGDKYIIRPRSARMLAFKKEGRTLVLPFVMHPGVRARHYIKTVLSRWTPILAERFGDAIELALVPSGRVPYL